MPTPDHSLTTLDIVKANLNLSDTTWDEVLLGAIDAVSRAIEDYCGRSFIARTLTAEKIDGDGTAELQLRFPVIRIDSLSNDGTAVVETTNYELYSDTGLVVLTDGSAWASGRKKLTITYRYGYEFDDLPRAITAAANLWTMKHFSDIKENRVGLSSVTRGDETVSYEKGMPREVKALVDPYVLAIGGWR